MDASLRERTTGNGIARDRTDPLYIPSIVTSLSAGIVDFALLAGSFAAAYALVAGVFGEAVEGVATAVLLGGQVGLVAVAVLAMMKGYARDTLRRPAAATLKFVEAWAVAFLLTGWAAFFLNAPQDVSRLAMSAAFGGCLAVAAPLRLLGLLAFKGVVSRARVATDRVIVIDDGGGSDVRAALDGLAQRGVDARAVLTYDALPSGSDESAARALVRRCRELLEREKAQAIYLSIDWSDLRRYRELRAALEPLPIPVFVLPDSGSAEILRGKHHGTGLGAHYEVKSTPLDELGRIQKRAVDIVVSSALIVALAPLMLLVAAAIRLETPGPVVFRQTRRGFSGRSFRILKFRSMTVCEDFGPIAQATRCDARVTRVGRFIRRTSIDELPQLFNVLDGEMSLVGPRPHALAHDDVCETLIVAYASRHRMKPGLTGWAQVNGCRGATPAVEHMAARVARDLWYIDNWSFWLDLRILVRTVPTVVFDRNAF